MNGCRNCRHIEVPKGAPPCLACVLNDNWEPMTPMDKEKACSGCRFGRCLAKNLPCSRCRGHNLFASLNEPITADYIERVLRAGGYVEETPMPPAPYIDLVIKMHEATGNTTGMIEAYRLSKAKMAQDRKDSEAAWRKAVNEKKNEQDGWVSVDKKLPEKEEKAIVRLKHDKEEYRVLTFKSSYWHGSQGVYIPLGHTTHWKPFKGMV